MYVNTFETLTFNAKCVFDSVFSEKVDRIVVFTGCGFSVCNDALFVFNRNFDASIYLNVFEYLTFDAVCVFGLFFVGRVRGIVVLVSCSFSACNDILFEFDKNFDARLYLSVFRILTFNAICVFDLFFVEQVKGIEVFSRVKNSRTRLYFLLLQVLYEQAHCELSFFL